MNNEYLDLRFGDCLEQLRTLSDESVDAIITDLPYGTTACKWDNVIPLEPLWLEYKRVAKPSAAIVLFGSEPFSSMLRVSNISNFKYDYVWYKNKASNFLTAKYAPLKYHEMISVFSTGKSKVKYNPQKYKVIELTDVSAMNKKQLLEYHTKRLFSKYGKIDRRKTVTDPSTNKDITGIKINRNRKPDSGFRNPKSIIEINKEARNRHPTKKPLELLEFLVKTYSDEGDTVLDSTMGSGTTGLACKLHNRRFIGIENDIDTYLDACSVVLD